MRHRALCWLGYHLIFVGLTMIATTAGLVLLREDSPRGGIMVYVILYAVAVASLWGGFRLLRAIGAWPPRADQ